MNFNRIVNDDYVPAAALGGLTNGVSPVEMASGFATIENEGYYRQPTCIVKITDSRDNLIYKNTGSKKKIYSKDATHMMISCLEAVVQSGTAKGLGVSNTPSAGKTGTTNDKKDGWFCGFTSYYTTAVWVGYDSPQSVPDLYGGTYPGRIWHNFMEQIHVGLEYAELPNDYANKKEYYEREEEEEEEIEITSEPVETVDIEFEEPEETEEPEEWTEGDVEEPEPEVPVEPEPEVEVTQPPQVLDPGDSGEMSSGGTADEYDPNF